jgi:hypothetical protein
MKVLYRTSTKSYNSSTIKSIDKTICITDNLTIYNDGNTNWVELSMEPRGEIISMVIFGVDGGDLVLDGKFNRSGTRVEMLAEENLTGKACEVKYISSL